MVDRRMATEPTRTGQVLAVQHGQTNVSEDPGPAGEDPLADRTRLPRTQNRPGHRPPRRPLVRRLAPPRHPHRVLAQAFCPMLRLDPTADAPACPSTPSCGCCNA